MSARPPAGDYGIGLPTNLLNTNHTSPQNDYNTKQPRLNPGRTFPMAMAERCSR
jgi:hypothetical protein